MCAALAAAFAALVALLYAMSVHTGAGDSDKATTILVGQAIGDGHLLAPRLDLVARQLLDYRRGLLRSCGPALRPSARALLRRSPPPWPPSPSRSGSLSTLEGRRGSAGLAGAVTVVALLGFVTPAMAFWFLGKGFHVATALYVLVSILGIRRGRFGWGWALGGRPDRLRDARRPHDRRIRVGTTVDCRPCGDAARAEVASRPRAGRAPG